MNVTSLPIGGQMLEFIKQYPMAILLPWKSVTTVGVNTITVASC